MTNTANLDLLIDAAEEEVVRPFQEIDRIAFLRQKKVLDAFDEERVDEACFHASTGYGYDDRGREVLDRVWARVMEAESAFVRHSILSGTHAITIALFGLLRPGDVMLSVTGTPYDTLHGVIGIGKSTASGSLKDFDISFESIEAKGDSPALESIEERLKQGKVRVVYIQKSPGYSNRPAYSNQFVEETVKLVRAVDPKVFVVVDNCYCEFCEEHEPCYYGADLCIGSLIKNPGGGMALCGGYLAGTKTAVDLCAQRWSCPGIGLEIGASLGQNRDLFKGLFYAPHTVAQALKTAVFAAALFDKIGFVALPNANAKRFDIVQMIQLQTPERVSAFCKGLQSASPIDSFADPVFWDMPGYDEKVIMAAGAFVQGASIELSADAPDRAPYTVYFQGGLTYESGKIGIIAAANEILKNQP